MNPKNLIVKEMTTSAKITSCIVSIIIILLLYVTLWIPQIPKQIFTPFYFWLLFHVTNQLIVAIDELKRK